MRSVRFHRREDGPTAVEYALVLALIVVVCVVAISALGTSVTRPFKKYSKSAGIWLPASTSLRAADTRHLPCGAWTVA
jgi:Flp pilus assembly pilin Flp